MDQMNVSILKIQVIWRVAKKIKPSIILPLFTFLISASLYVAILFVEMRSF